MNTETTGAENTLPEQNAPRKSGRPPLIMNNSTTDLIRLESDLKYHVLTGFKTPEMKSEA
jgi:hypothetical protein